MGIFKSLYEHACMSFELEEDGNDSGHNRCCEQFVSNTNGPTTNLPVNQEILEPVPEPEQHPVTEVDQPHEGASIPSSTQPQVRRSMRSTKGAPAEKLSLLTCIYTIVQELSDAEEKAKLKAIKAEILLIFKELKAVMPVFKKDIPEDVEILRSFIFLVEKYLANGEFDKTKARKR